MKLMITIIVLFMFPFFAVAEGEGEHSHVQHESTSSQLTTGTGVINSVEEGKINISHGPIEKLNWPAMKMDLPVTKDVDLSKVKAGDKITFSIELGSDKVYRITKIMPDDSHRDDHKH